MPRFVKLLGNYSVMGLNIVYFGEEESTFSKNCDADYFAKKSYSRLFLGFLFFVVKAAAYVKCFYSQSRTNL